MFYPVHAPLNPLHEFRSRSQTSEILNFCISWKRLSLDRMFELSPPIRFWSKILLVTRCIYCHSLRYKIEDLEIFMTGKTWVQASYSGWLQVLFIDIFSVVIVSVMHPEFYVYHLKKNRYCIRSKWTILFDVFQWTVICKFIFSVLIG